MKDRDIIILVASVAGSITVLIILCCVLLWFLPRRSDKAYLAAARARSRQEVQARTRASTATATNLQETNFRPIAEENAYVVGPTATIGEAQRLPRLPGSRSRATLPANMFLSSDTGQVLRFYTASELRNFPFDEHIAELRREIEAEEARRPQPTRRSHHWLLSPDRSYPPSYHDNNNEIVIRTPEPPSSILFRPPNNIVINPIMEDEEEPSNEDQRPRTTTITTIPARPERRRLCFSIPNYVGQTTTVAANYSMPPTYAEVVNTTNGTIGEYNTNNNNNNNNNTNNNIRN